jgi:uncharacterized DUF497 family protein
MNFEWDEAKRLSNLRKHGTDFADIEDFDWQGAQYRDDLSSTTSSGLKRCRIFADASTS